MVQISWLYKKEWKYVKQLPKKKFFQAFYSFMWVNKQSQLTSPEKSIFFLTVIINGVYSKPLLTPIKNTKVEAQKPTVTNFRTPNQFARLEVHMDPKHFVNHEPQDKPVNVFFFLNLCDCNFATPSVEGARGLWYLSH